MKKMAMPERQGKGKDANPQVPDLKTTKIAALSHDGRGIAKTPAQTVFVSGALPDEVVTYKVHTRHSHYHEADIETLMQASLLRVQPPCEHFGVCGGCSLQHLHADAQLVLKEQTLLEQLQGFAKLVPQQILAPIKSHTTNYRHKARLGVKFVIKKNKVLVGFREKKSRYLADLNSCMVLHASIGEKLPALAELIRSLDAYQTIPQIEVAIGDTEIALVFRHLENLSVADQEKLLAYGQKNLFNIYLQPNPPAKVHQIYPQHRSPRLAYRLPDFNLEFLFHPLDFTQINLDVNRLMVNQAIAQLDLQPTDKVLDLFCGIGNFTLAIAKHANHVVGIEGSEEMVLRAMENAQHNNIANVSYYAANLMADLNGQVWVKQQYDKIVLDPPRAGAKELLAYIAQSSTAGAMLGAKKIVYVSCNPATLARDAAELVHQYGYTLKGAGIINMFPHTAHIEAMAVFEKI